nr:carbohydrate sulfotransferase 9-like isoform X1 [Macaca nemestrina]
MQPFEMVMNPKQVFLSVLIFGVAGLLLFMYLQVWIEEQHTGRVEKRREQKVTSGWGPMKYLQPVPRIILEAGKSKIKGLASAKGPFVTSSHGGRLKSKKTQERARGTESNSSFYQESTPTITHPLSRYCH